MTVLNRHSVRTQRELDTVTAMIRLYCKTLHRGAITCPECESLFEYVESRMANCRLVDEKPSCLQCQGQCYQSAKRLQVMHVVRWSLPRFLWRHPVKALQFKVDEIRSNTILSSRKTGDIK